MSAVVRSTVISLFFSFISLDKTSYCYCYSFYFLWYGDDLETLWDYLSQHGWGAEIKRKGEKIFS